MYRTYSYNDMPEPVRRHREEKPAPTPRAMSAAPKKEPVAETKCKDGILSGIFDNFENDDIILIVVAIVLLMDDCDDKLLLLALAFIFISDKF